MAWVAFFLYHARPANGHAARRKAMFFGLAFWEMFMHKFDYSKTWQKTLVPDVVALLTTIHEYKGRQGLFIDSKAESLTQLLEIAKIQSTEASNNIEGIFTSDDRLKKIVNDKTHPQNRNEQEIAGYRDVLSTIHENYAYVPFKPNIILQLHKNLYKYSGTASAGRFKAADNVIAEIDAMGNETVRFLPVEAWETPQAADDLCAAFENALKDGEVDPLIIIPMSILDFLCIHPFSDGNGRMSRLLTLLLLYQAGYTVGKYISIEKIIEQSKETYYETLRQSSVGWHKNESDYTPFIRYMLGVVLKAYKVFFERTELLTEKGISKPDRIAALIKNTLGKITKTEILRQCPDVSEVTVQRTLAELLKNSDIIKIGGGRYTQYIWNKEKGE